MMQEQVTLQHLITSAENMPVWYYSTGEPRQAEIIEINEVEDEEGVIWQVWLRFLSGESAIRSIVLRNDVDASAFCPRQAS